MPRHSRPGQRIEQDAHKTIPSRKGINLGIPNHNLQQRAIPTATTPSPTFFGSLPSRTSTVTLVPIITTTTTTQRTRTTPAFSTISGAWTTESGTGATTDWLWTTSTPESTPNVSFPSHGNSTGNSTGTISTGAAVGAVVAAVLLTALVAGIMGIRWARKREQRTKVGMQKQSLQKQEEEGGISHDGSHGNNNINSAPALYRGSQQQQQPYQQMLQGEGQQHPSFQPSYHPQQGTMFPVYPAPTFQPPPLSPPPLALSPSMENSSFAQMDYFSPSSQAQRPFSSIVSLAPALATARPYLRNNSQSNAISQPSAPMLAVSTMSSPTLSVATLPPYSSDLDPSEIGAGAGIMRRGPSGSRPGVSMDSGWSRPVAPRTMYSMQVLGRDSGPGRGTGSGPGSGSGSTRVSATPAVLENMAINRYQDHAPSAPPMPQGSRSMPRQEQEQEQFDYRTQLSQQHQFQHQHQHQHQERGQFPQGLSNHPRPNFVTSLGYETSK